MNKTKNKHKAPKNVSTKQNGFFRALVLGFFTCAVVWVALALVFALVMSNMEDSNSPGPVFSQVIVIISLLAGGFVAGKADKSCAPLTAVILGCAVLGICYCLGTAFDLSRDLGSAMKTVVIAIMLICPIVGAYFSTREKKVKRPHRKRM